VLITYGVFDGSDPSYTSRTNAFLSTQNGATGDFYVLQLAASPHLFGCQLVAQLWQFTNNKPSSFGNTRCVQSEASVDAFDLAVVGGESHTLCGSGNYPGVVMYTDSATVVYADYLCIDLQNKTIIINGNNGETRPVNVDIGSVPSVSMVQHAGEIYVFSVHGESYCWNNEVHNKQAGERLCDNKPFSMPYMLTYNFGSFADWASHISSHLKVNEKDKDAIDKTFGSCHPTILHGTYDSGSNPTTALFTSKDPVTKKEVLLFAEVHQGVPDNVVDKYACGLAVSMPGLVLDSWPINDWVV